MKHIETKKGLETLLTRYLENGVSDTTKDISNSYEAKWISTIKNCIKNNLAMDEDDYENTSKELRKLWKGLK